MLRCRSGAARPASLWGSGALLYSPGQHTLTLQPAGESGRETVALLDVRHCASFLKEIQELEVRRAPIGQPQHHLRRTSALGGPLGEIPQQTRHPPLSSTPKQG